jgi:hypothetical protein
VQSRQEVRNWSQRRAVGERGVVLNLEDVVTFCRDFLCNGVDYLTTTYRRFWKSTERIRAM